MKKKNESTERTIPVKKENNSRLAFLYRFRNREEIPPENKQQILEEMIDAVLDDKKEFLSMIALYRHFGLRRSTVMEWRKVLPNFDRDFQFIKDTIADKKYAGALKKKYDALSARGVYGDFQHPELKEDYSETRKELHELSKDLEKFKSELRKSFEETISDLVVNLREIPRKVTHEQDSGSDTPV